MCIRLDSRKLDWGILYADTRPQYIQLDLNPTIIWVRAANQIHI